MPRIEPLHQNTPRWHDWRRHGVGSSDAPVIMGETAFRTAKMLWSLKTGKLGEARRSPAAQRGHLLESPARRAYERYSGITVEPVCMVHDEFDWMRASLDGLTFEGSIVLEIKCPINGRDHAAARAGRIPPQYYAQLQHQLEVSKAAELHYWSFDGHQGSLVRVQPNRDYLGRLIEAETAFWTRVCENSWPDGAPDELDLSASDEWRSAADNYRSAKARLEKAVLDEQQARQWLEQMATARRTFGSGVELVRTTRKGTVDYSLVPELKGLNLERYRKAAVEVVKINILRPDEIHT